jgi:hypothetical protein
MATVENKHLPGSVSLSWRMFAGIGVVSTAYFADIFLKASRKCFWFDELFTVYLSRLPSFKDTLMAVAHGADFNPALFYLLMRGARQIFGEGLIATRLPAILGVWLFAVCLSLFVARRAGGTAAFIAGVFPYFTLAKYYSYEARPHGIVLGWCGLMLLCWQRSAEGRARYLWLVGFGLSFLGALLTHVYAVYLVVPFAIVEIYNLAKRGRPDWGIVTVMATVLIAVAVTVYLPLLRQYRTTVPANFRGATFGSLERFLINVIGPATIVVFLFLVLFAAHAMLRNRDSHATSGLPQREMVLAAGFACIPLAGLIGCKLSHGPFLDRYFLSSIAGYAIFAGLASSSCHLNASIGKALAGCMFLLMLADLASTIHLSASNQVVLFEPSSGLRLSTTPSNPLQIYQTLSVDHGGLDILVLPNLEYLYLVSYAPTPVVPHLYYGAPGDDVSRVCLERLAKWARIDLQTTSFDPFLASHKHFLLYESESLAGGSATAEALQAIARGGYRLKSTQADMEGILYEYEK